MGHFLRAKNHPQQLFHTFFCVIRPMGTYYSRQGTSLTASSHIFKNLGSLGIYLRFYESFSIAFLSIS